MALKKQQGLFDGVEERTYSNIVWSDACVDPLGVAPIGVKAKQYMKWLNERHGKINRKWNGPSAEDIDWK